MSTVFGQCEVCAMPVCGNCITTEDKEVNFLPESVKNRCMDCGVLSTNEDGTWICDEKALPCAAVKECPEGVE